MRPNSHLPRSRRAYTVFLLVVGVAAFAAACGDTGSSSGTEGGATSTQNQTTETMAGTSTAATSPGGTTAGTGVDACALVTKEEAEAVLGNSVGDPIEETYPPIYGCSYETSDFDVVSITVTEYSDAAEADAAFQMAVDINSYEEVSGIGDRAYRAWPIYDINVLVDRYEISIDVADSGTEDEQFQEAQGLAEIALNRMP